MEMLLGDDFFKLQNAKILLLGVGGVGSFCLDCLYRSGVKAITIVDFDSYDITNQNRQMWSELHEGESKVASLKRHYPELETIECRVDEAWVWAFDFEPYDLVLDAIDDTKAKLALAQKCYKKLISSFGSAKRLDPTEIKVDDVFKSYGDPFGAKIRYELKKRGFKKKYTVVFSSEAPNVKEKGSFMGVTAAFGLTMCSEAVKRLSKLPHCHGVIGDGCGGDRIFYIKNEQLFAFENYTQREILLQKGFKGAKKITKEGCLLFIECHGGVVKVDLQALHLS